MNKGELIEALRPFTDEIRLVTRTEGDGEYKERTFSKIEYHFENDKAKIVLIQNPSIVGMYT